MIKLVSLYLLLVAVSASIFLFTNLNKKSSTKPVQNILNILPSPKPQIELIQPLQSKVLPTDYHVFQTFNNCGPAALSMALRFYGVNETQQALGQSLRPYQVASGDNDDKSTTLEELAEKSKEYGFVPYHRPNGNIDLIKLFITYDMPVITRTWTKINEDIGHYRVVKGYDETTGEIIQDDSLQNKNLRFAYSDFNSLWNKFNYEYLVLVPKDKVEIAEVILGEDADPKKAWEKAAQTSQNKLKNNPNDITQRFNLSVALYNIGDYQGSVREFEKAESQLPFRTLWYQIEPIKAYFELGNYERVFTITDRVLNPYNRAFSELYILRGQIYLKQGDKELAREEFEKAVFYNINLKSAQDALNSI